MLRLLACRQTMPPDLVFPAMNTEGDLCTSSYVSHQSGGPVGSGRGLDQVGDTRGGMWEMGVGRMCLTPWGDTWGWHLG